MESYLFHVSSYHLSGHAVMALYLVSDAPNDTFIFPQNALMQVIDQFSVNHSESLDVTHSNSELISCESPCQSEIFRTRSGVFKPFNIVMHFRF